MAEFQDRLQNYSADYQNKHGEFSCESLGGEKRKRGISYAGTIRNKIPLETLMPGWVCFFDGINSDKNGSSAHDVVLLIQFFRNFC
jgi:hypothetical protein